MMDSLARAIKAIFFWIASAAGYVADAIIDLIDYLRLHPRARHTSETILLVGLLVLAAYTFVLGAPAHFPQGSLLRVPKGATLAEVASELREKRLINYAFLFELLARVERSDGTIVAGEYAFNTPQNIVTIARRLTSGDFELEPMKVRVVEGMDSAQVSELLRKNVPDFDADAFYQLARMQEGKLFPDTYFFLPGSEPELVLSAMIDNFNEQIRAVPVAAAITAFGKPINDVLTMASILEKEAATTQDRRIIAGILWHRLSIGMRLQVDATFLYINGKNTFTLTKDDLAMDSPYNTYVNKGLPPTPIGSPSVDAILAAVEPLTTSYVYYLSDKAGVVHYSTTYEQHLEKKKKYLGT